MMMMMMMMIMMMTRKSDLNSERSLTILLSAQPVNLIVRFMNMYTVVISVTGHLLSSKSKQETQLQLTDRAQAAHTISNNCGAFMVKVKGKGLGTCYSAMHLHESDS